MIFLFHVTTWQATLRDVIISRALHTARKEMQSLLHSLFEFYVHAALEGGNVSIYG